MLKLKALIDSGCTNVQLDREFVNKKSYPKEKKNFNINFSLKCGWKQKNIQERITHHTEVMMRMEWYIGKKMDFGIQKLVPVMISFSDIRLADGTQS